MPFIFVNRLSLEYWCAEFGFFGAPTGFFLLFMLATVVIVGYNPPDTYNMVVPCCSQETSVFGELECPNRITSFALFRRIDAPAASFGDLNAAEPPKLLC